MSTKFITKYSKSKNKDILTHKFCKIMFLSCVYICDGKYELTYLLDYVYKNNRNITLIPIKKYITYEEYVKVIKSKFGVWFRSNSNILDFNYLYIYQNMNNNKLIYKTTNNDNYLNKDSINQYSHKLIFKSKLNSSNVLLEYI